MVGFPGGFEKANGVPGCGEGCITRHLRAYVDASCL